jgi:hypothetical protein
VGKLRGIEYMSEIGEPLVKLYARYRAGTTRVMLSVGMSDSSAKSQFSFGAASKERTRSTHSRDVLCGMNAA